ncbi:MAG: hypothetical protein IK990_16115 [Ruminiclostridium sp.]|nr:hypothetical protein [Ruminiclostridium sp.]
MDGIKQPKNSSAKIKANNRYRAKTYKRILLDIRPEIDEEIRNEAKEKGLSVTSYLVGLHKKHMEEKNGENQ